MILHRHLIVAALLGVWSVAASGQDMVDAGASVEFVAEQAVEQPTLITHAELGFRLPPGFRATVFHQGIEHQRFMAVSSDGVVFVNRKERGLFGDGIIALKDDDGDGVADRSEGFADFPGSGIAVRTDDVGQEWLYASSKTEVFRWALKPGELAPSSNRERIAYGFPRQGEEHPWKPIAFDEQGGMYVMVGAPSNACMEKRRTKGSPGQRPCPQLEWQSGVWRFDADAPDQHQRDAELFATGVRNMIAFAWSRDQNGLYGAQHGRDFFNRYFPELFTPQQGADLPSEEFHRIDRGDDLGWPYSYYDHFAGERRINPEYESEDTPNRGRNRTDDYKSPVYGFPGHWAPSGLAFYEANGGFPDIYRQGAFVVFKGGWGRNPHPPQAGYRIVFVPLEAGELAAAPVVFANGFEGRRPDDYPEELPFPTSIHDAALLPLGLTFGPDGAMYLGDVQKQHIWRITYAGDDAAAADLAALKRDPTRMAWSVIDTVAGVARDTTAVANAITGREPEAMAATAAAPAGPDTRSLGQRAYDAECATCHQRDGRGVDGFAPTLIGSTILAGDPANLALYTLMGVDAPNPNYSNVMPAYREGPLSDEELIAALSYARQAFADAGPVGADDFAMAKDALPPLAGTE